LKVHVSSKFTQTDDVDPTNSTETTAKELEIKRKEEDIRGRLKLTERQLKLCKHESEITKTCRAIIKCLLPNSRKQASMSISQMSTQMKYDIRGNCTSNYYKIIIFTDF